MLKSNYMTDGSVSPEQAIPKSVKEIEVGGGDPLRITAFEGIQVKDPKALDIELEIVKLPDEALEQATEQLRALPFAVGNKNFIGTPGMRDKHDVVVRIGPRSVAYNAPEDEKGKSTLYFRFGERAGQYGLHLATNKDLTIVQNRDPDNGQMRNIVSFSPDKPLNIAGREIREIELVMPVEAPAAK